jgi:GAF domain-containing protein
MNFIQEKTMPSQFPEKDPILSLEDINIVCEFGNKVLSSTSLGEISELLFDLVEKNIPVQVSSLFLFLKNGVIERISIRGRDIEGNYIEDSWLGEGSYKGESYWPGESFSGKVVKAEKGFVYGTPILSNNIKEDYKLKYSDEYEEKIGLLRNGMSIPLNGTHHTFGTIEVINKCDGDFTQKDLCWLRLVGAHISTAISRLRKNKQDEIVKYLVNNLVSNKRIGQINDIAKYIAKCLVEDQLMPYKVCIFRFICAEGNSLVNRGTFRTSDLEEPQKDSIRRIYQGLVGKVYRTKEPVEINKINDDSIKLFVNRKWIKKSELKSFFCFPLIYQGKAIGTMSIFTGYEHELHDGDRKFLQEVSLLMASCQSVIDDRSKFDELKESVDSIEESDLSSIEKTKNLIDKLTYKQRSTSQGFPYKAESFLLHEFKIYEENTLSDSKVLLPMLLKVKDFNWKAQEIADYVELYRSDAGSFCIIACKGSYETVEALNEEFEIISINADHVMLRS